MPDVGRVVHVGQAAHLAYRDLHLIVERDGREVGRVPLEDLAVLVLDFAPITMTAPLLAALAEARVATVVCGSRHLPSGILLPVSGAVLHPAVLREQIEASLPRKKRIWQQIVCAKVRAQAAVLRRRHGSDGGLARLARDVRSGDAGNVEAQAARRYFVALFGPGFARDPAAGGLNVRLNYGYALLRAAMARALTGAGLHPALGIHHHNRSDAYALADDAMEPLRPLVDERVAELASQATPSDDLKPSDKQHLLQVLCAEVRWQSASFPLLTALERYAAALRECIAGRERKLPCPEV